MIEGKGVIEEDGVIEGDHEGAIEGDHEVVIEGDRDGVTVRPDEGQAQYGCCQKSGRRATRHGQKMGCGRVLYHPLTRRFQKFIRLGHLTWGIKPHPSLAQVGGGWLAPGETSSTPCPPAPLLLALRL